MKDKITFSNSFGEKYHMPADGPHRVTIGNITHVEPLAEQLKTVLQREADSQRRHDEKVERLEAENERLREALRETSKQGAFEMTKEQLEALEDWIVAIIRDEARDSDGSDYLKRCAAKDVAIEAFSRAALGETK